MITLYTPATGLPDLEAKIAYGLARVGIEAFGIKNVLVKNEGGFYSVVINGDMHELNRSFNLIIRRLLSSEFIPANTPGISGRSATRVVVGEGESFALDHYQNIEITLKNTPSENLCRHNLQSIGNIIGFASSTSYHKKRNGINVSIQRVPRRPTNPKKLCKTCGLVSLLGEWYATFFFNIADREVVVVPILKDETTGTKLQEIFSLQHFLRKEWIRQEIPQTLIPMVTLSKIPSASDILKGFDLFIAVLSRPQGYHVDGLYLIEIDKYLNFLADNPFNIAIIDIMLIRKAFNALQELNDAIYFKKKEAMLKFPRIYVQETSTSNWVNLLYPETTKYLLKEVAMINEEVIKNRAVRSIARTLGYFVWNKDYQNYSFADGLRSAKTHREVRQIFEKLLREAKLRYDQEINKEGGSPPHLPHPDDIEEINRLMQRDQRLFEEVKTTLYLLAFSWESYKTIKIE